MKILTNEERGYALFIQDDLVFFEWIYEGKKYGMSFNCMELARFKSEIELIIESLYYGGLDGRNANR